MPSLNWDSSGTDEPRDQVANSTTRVASGSTSAYYLIGPHAGDTWTVELVQTNRGEERHAEGRDLGQFADEHAAKVAAAYFERYGGLANTDGTVTYLAANEHLMRARLRGNGEPEQFSAWCDPGCGCRNRDMHEV